MFDVAIIGASVAGATLGYSLGRAGYSVALIDQSTFARSKPCGEGLSGLGVAVFNELGIDLAKLTPVLAFHGYAIYPNHNKPYVIPHSTAGYGVERAKLDSVLLSLVAQQPSVSLFLGSRVNGLDGARGLVFTEDQVISAKIVVEACGQSAEAGSSSQSKHSSRFGVTFHLSGNQTSAASTVSILNVDEGSIFCTPLPDNRLNVAFLSHAKTKGAGLRKRVREQFIPRLLDRMRWDASIEDGGSGCCLSLQKRAPVVSNRLLRIGDAREQLDPVGGLGMTHAIISAALASTAISAALRNRSVVDREFLCYSKRLEAAARPLRAFTMLTRKALVDWGHLSLCARLSQSSLVSRFVKAASHPDHASAFERRALSLLGRWL